MSYCRKRSGKWYYTICWTTPDGKSHRSEHVGGLNKSSCRKAWRAAMSELDTTGIYMPPSERTMQTCLNEWLDDFVNIQLKQNTIDSYEGVVNNHLIPAFGQRPIKDMTIPVLQDWLNAQRNTYSHSTLKTFHAVLKSSFEWLLTNRKYITDNPMDHVIVPRAVAPNPSIAFPSASLDKVRVFSPDEIKTIFSHFGPDHQFHMPLLLGYYCGMRLGECLALTWNHVDLQSHSIAVVANQYDKTGMPISSTPKSPKSSRIVTFAQKLYNELKQQQWRQKENKFKAGPFYHQTNFVCTSESGDGMTSNDIRYFGQWCKKMFGGGSFHSLRHTHATMLIESGVGIDYVSKRLGHASVYTTANIYDNVTDRREQEVVSLMDKIL